MGELIAFIPPKDSLRRKKVEDGTPTPGDEAVQTANVIIFPGIRYVPMIGPDAAPKGACANSKKRRASRARKPAGV